jgi:hypothetical protein
MPHILTNAEYVDVLYVYGFCDGNVTALLVRLVECFPWCSVHCVKVVRFSLLMFHYKEHVNVCRNRKTFLKWCRVALLVAPEHFLHDSVFQEHVYGEHCMVMACSHFTRSVCKIYTQGTVPCV